MPVVRTQHTEDYTVLPNRIVRDPRLSLRDKALLWYMLSKPPDWKFTRENIVASMDKDGETSIRSGVKNLEQAGYLVITKAQRCKGKFPETIWTVYDIPQLQNADVVTPYVENQHTDNAPQLQNAVKEKKRKKKRKKNKPYVGNNPVVKAQEMKPKIYAPHGGFPPVDNTPDYKVYNNKKANAVSAIEGGPQRSGGLYYDDKSGEYRRKEIV